MSLVTQSYAAGIDKTVNAMREAAPLVHCMTNTVVQNVTANVLLAAGQAPAMVDHPGEAATFAQIASGVLINTGTVAPHQVESMPLAAEAAVKAGVPWVLDPVAIGALEVRTSLAHRLLELAPTAIRGNASEISALAGLGAGGRGVDATDSVDDALPAAASLAERTGAVVAVSGKRDLIVWDREGDIRALWLESGHDLMPRVIGTGCALGATMAGYVSIAPALESLFSDATFAPVDAKALAVLSAHAHVGAAGQLAGERASRPGSFAVAWIDALDELSGADIAASVRVTEASA